MNIHYGLILTETDTIDIDYFIEQSKFLKSLIVNLIVKTNDVGKLKFKQVMHLSDKVSITTESIENKPGFSKVSIEVLKI